MLNLKDIMELNKFTKVLNIDRKLSYSFFNFDEVEGIINFRCNYNPNMIFMLDMIIEEVDEFVNPICIRGTSYKFY